MVITCDGPKIAVEFNGETVTRMDLDEWTEPNRRPDGSEHKFDVAYKDHPAVRLHRPAGPRLAMLVQEHQAQAARAVSGSARRWRVRVRALARRPIPDRRQPGDERRMLGRGAAEFDDGAKASRLSPRMSAWGSSHKPGKTSER